MDGVCTGANSSTTTSLLLEEIDETSSSVGEYHPSIPMLSLNYHRIFTPGYQLVKPLIQQLEHDE